MRPIQRLLFATSTRLLLRSTPSIVALLIMIISAVSVNAQSLQALVPSVPTSPQAEAFKMYGDYTVNPSTGTPDISIPLYEINHRGYKMPLALKYAARPLKPGYNYDVFGLGWAMPVTGSISRSIEYVPDELRNFTLEVPGVAISNFNICGNACITDYNYAHDKFNATLPNGTSFEFIIDNQYGTINFQVSDGRQVKIAYGLGNSQIQWFTIIDEQGVKYTFDGADTPRPGYGSFHNTFVSWQLSRIDLPYSTEPILFYYGSEMSPFGVTFSEPSLRIADYYKKVSEGGQLVFYHNYTASRPDEYIPNGYKMRLLTSIQYGTSRVNLTYKNQNVFANSYQVDKMEVRENLAVVKEISFLTTMHGGGFTYSFPTAVLDKVRIKGANTNAAPMEYELSYNSIGFFSGIDHWGNLNSYGMGMPNFNVYVGWDMAYSGHASGIGLTPITKEMYDPSPFYKFNVAYPGYAGSDCRRADEPSQHGVLNRIKYPTGGYTNFEFENHKFLTSQRDNGNFEFNPEYRVAKNASSYRIKTITSYASDGAPTGKKNYRYGVPLEYGHTGWGEPVVDPNITTYLSYSNYYINVPFLITISPKNMVMGLDPNGQHQPFSNPFVSPQSLNFEWAWIFTLSSANFRRLLNGRQQVVYPEVTVYEGDIDENNKVYPKGKTVYKYKYDGDYPGETFFEPAKTYGNTLGYEAKPYYYNRLVEKTDYRYDVPTQQFKLLRKEENTYMPSANSYFDYQFGSNYLPECLVPSTVGDFAYGQWPVSGAYFGRPSYQGASLLYDKRVTEYTDQGDNISNYEFYLYNSRAQLTRTTRLRSDGKATIKTFTYPEVVIGIDPPEIIEDMVAQNIISPVIETTTSIYPGGGTVAGGKVEYAKFGSNQAIMPAKSYEMEVSSSGVEYALKAEAKSYSANGNPLEIASIGNFYTAHLWGYNDRYMVAEVKNATVNQVAYSSFEDDSKGNWTYTGTLTTPSAGTFVPTGKKYYNLASGNELSKAVTNGNRYTISYWRNAASPYTISGGTGIVSTGITVGGWTYFEHKVTANTTTISISGTGGLDEVRLFPADAQMTTYTYDPLIGITSQSNASGHTAYYIYDSFGRLSLIRDQNNNILKRYCYNYQNQVEECPQ